MTGCGRGAVGLQGKGTPSLFSHLSSAIVVLVTVAIAVVAKEMAVACLTRPSRAVASVIDAHCCSALWEGRREGREDSG